MGAATIITNQGDGLYSITKTIRNLDGELAKLASLKADLGSELLLSENTLGQLWRQVEMKRAAFDAIMAQWLSGEIRAGSEDEEIVDPETEEAIIRSDYTNQVIALTNAERGGGLSSNSELTQAAQGHANFMASYNNGISHTGSGGSTPAMRIAEAGYVYLSCAENIASGQTTPREVVTAWMNSPGHRANILYLGFVDIGVGLAVDPQSQYRYYWCQCFGTPQ